MAGNGACNFVSVVLLGLCLSSLASSYRLVCYFTNWAQYRQGIGQFLPEDIPPDLCTHVVYAFADIEGDTSIVNPLEWNDLDFYKRVMTLKSTNPQLKVLLAVGGYSAGTADFEAISSSSAQRQLFADNAVSFLSQHGFDGLDVDWEYPASTYKTRFTLLLETLHNTFEAESSRTGNDQLLLTVAVSGYKIQIETSYEVHLIHNYVDYVSIMSYDYYGPWSSVLGHNSPLYVPSQDRNAAGSSLLSQSASVHYWHTLGCPLDKLVLGLASYGRTFLMSSSSQHQPGDPYLGAAGAAGAYSATPGFLAYYEVCQLLDSFSWTRVWMNDSKVPYAYGLTNGQWTWLAYDDVQSMKTKAQYILDRGLGGAMFWTLDFDDFGNNACSQGNYPLIGQIGKALQAAPPPSSTSTGMPASSSTLVAVTTPAMQVSTSQVDPSGLHRVCYFTNWAQYRSGVGKYVPEDYQPGLCTHVVYAFAKIIGASASISTIEWNDEDMYQRVIRLKDTDPQLKVLLAVGGYSAGTADFEAISSSSAQRQLFADNAVSFLRQHGFDGLDVDWEYPASTHKTYFTLFLQTLHNTFEAETSCTGKDQLLLTVAVSGYEIQIETSYEVHLIHKYVDYISIMSYDYYGPWSSVLGHNSPLYVPSQDRNTAGSSLLSQNASVHYWHTLGCPLDKLVLGLASYGRTFLMSSSSQHQPGDPYLGAAGAAGAYSATPGFLAYYEVCQLLDSGIWTRVWMNDSKVPYAYGLTNGQWTWLAYDDVQSMTYKADYIVDRGLGGAMFWTLDFDDFGNSTCKEGRYPLITEMQAILQASTAITATETTYTSLTVTSTSRPSSSTSESTISTGLTSSSTVPTVTSTELQSTPDTSFTLTSTSSTVSSTSSTTPPAASSTFPPVTSFTDTITSAKTDQSCLRVVCYFTNWAQYRLGVGKYVPEDYQPGLCTHMVYAFAKITSASASLSTIEWNDEDMYQRVIRLKDTDPQLKVLLAVGGYSAGTADFEAISSSSAQRQLFADNAVSFLRQHGFDGLDVDWEFPASTYKTHFTLLLGTLHNMFEAESSRTGKDQLLLTVAVSGYKTQIETSYEVHLIHNYVEYVSIMSYDYYGPWSSVLGHNSPLYVPSQDKNTAGSSLLSQNASVHYWHTLGCPLDKLVLGLASYGRTFLMSSSSQHQPGDPYLGAAGAAGPYSATPGFLAYYEVCQLLDSGSWTRVWMNDSKVPYAYGLRNGQWTWLAYDDVQSMKTKAQFILNRGLGGAMFWTLDFVDFRNNVCSQGDYPLIGQIRNALQAAGPLCPISTSTVMPASSSSPVPVTTPGTPVSTSPTDPSRLHLVCYFTNWAQYRFGVGKYVPEDYQPGLCTHVVYAFAKIISASASLSTIEWNDENMYQRVIRLKDTDPQLKVLLAVGGYSAGTADFEAISSSSAQRQLFADNAVSFLRQHGFDGLDVDWEYPASTHKTYFTLLLEILHSTFEAESSRTGKDKLLLTVAVSGYKTQIETSYEVHLIHNYVDYISIMSYDYYGPWSSVLGHNSPLYVPSQDRNTADFSLLSQNASVHYWHTLGCPLDKLVLGLASYGRTFLMSSSSQHQPGDPYLGAAGAAGAYSATPGFLAYYEVCQLLDSGSWTRVWMNDSKVPYAYGLTNGQWTWLAYDDVQSMKTKADFIVDRGLGGAMFWTLDFDDFGNTCNEGHYPLMSEMKTALQAVTAITTTDTTYTSPNETIPATTSTEPPTTSTEPATTSTEPPTTSSTQRPTTSSTQPPATSSTEPPTTSTQPPTTSTQPPTTSSTQPPTTSSTEPPTTSSTQPPTTSSTESPTTSSTEPPTTTSTEPPTTSSTEPTTTTSTEPTTTTSTEPTTTTTPKEPTTATSTEPTTRTSIEPTTTSSTEPPTTTSTEPPTTSSTEPTSTTSREPPTTSSTEPTTTTSTEPTTTTSTAPPTTSSTEPSTTSSTEPPTTSSTEPPTAASTEPPTTSSTEPPITSSTEPPATSSTEPPITSSTKPPTTSSTQPSTMSSTDPPTTSSTDLSTTSSTDPPTTSSTDPPTTSSTDPPTTSSTEPPTTSSTEPSTTSSTEPPTTSSTEPSTTSSTNPPTTSTTQPVTTSTEPPNTSSTEPPTTSSTEPPTMSSTEPPTTSSTQPPTKSSTEPPTTSSTEPPTTSSTQPPITSSTQPPTTSSTQPPTTSSSMLSTTVSTKSSTVVSTTSTMAPSTSSSESPTPCLRVVCYFTNWAQYRSGVGKYVPEDYQPGLCTHVVYAFAKITSASASLSTIEWNDEDMYRRVIRLKDTDPQLKVLLAVGGYSAGTADFEAISSSSAQRQLFADNAVSFLRQHGFDGLDVDWEFPARTHKTYFTLFLETLHNTFEAESARTGQERLLLTVAVSGYKMQIETSYEVHLIHNYVDYVSIMSYDYYGPWSSVLGHNSPLYVPSQDKNTAGSNLLSQNASVHYWHTLGCPLDKLVLGLASYGRTFLMSSSSQHQPGDPYLGAAGAAGAYSATPGFLAYYEVCQLLDSGSWTRVWMNDSKVPYAYGLRNGQWTWLAYDDVQSMKTKTQFILDKGLGGAMFWTLDFDDFGNNVCNQGVYPLIGQIGKALQSAGPSCPVSTVMPASSSTPVEVTTPATQVSTSQVDPSGLHLVCYFTNWAQYRSGVGKYVPEDYQPGLCTHVVYAFAKIISASASLATIEWNDEDMYQRVIRLKDTDPQLKVLLAVGGYSAGTADFEAISSSSAQRQLFADNAVSFLRQHGFDGLDVDWEYPASTHKTYFTLLLETLHSTFEAESSRTGKDQMLLTVAVSGYKTQIETSYEVHLIHKYVDYISIMSYDYYGPWSSVLGHNSPLYVPSQDTNTAEFSLLSQNASVHYWHTLGCPLDKLVLGLASYGRTFLMSSSSQHQPGDPYLGAAGAAGPYSATPGFLAYYEVCQLLDSGSWTRVWMNDSKVPYAYGLTNGQWTWLAYDDPRSMKHKADYIMERGLGGAMFWTLDFDDFSRNVCNAGLYPLISEIKTALQAATATTATDTTYTTLNVTIPATTSTDPPTTSTQQPTALSTERPTTSSTQPPTTSSTQPPTTSTKQPTTSSTEPPTAASTQPPTTSSTQPPTTSSTQPSTTSTEPPTTSSTEPPTTSSTLPPTAASTEPSTTSSTQPPTTSYTEPATTSTEPATTSTEPATTSTEPPTTSSTEPSTTSSTEPPTTSSTQPPTTSSTQPPTTSTELPTTPSTEPPTTSTQPPTTSSTQPPTTSSIQPPATSTQPSTTSSTQPPTTSSTQPPTTSTEPPTTSSTQPPTRSTEPPTTSSTQPPTTSTQPPTTSSTQPPTTSSTQPPATSTQPSTTSSTQPPTTSSTQPPTISTEPSTTSSTQPPTTSKEPPTTSSTQPPATSSEPPTTSSTQPPTTSTEPPTTSSTQPPATSTEPPTTSSTQPPTTSTEPPTTSSTQPPTTSTEPPTTSSTQPPTTSTEPPTTSSTQPPTTSTEPPTTSSTQTPATSTQPPTTSTQPPTTSSTQPPTTSTEPPTTSSTEPPTTSTEPSTTSSTQPRTMSSTEPQTTSSTQPQTTSTQPPTTSSTQPPTTSTKPPTTSTQLPTTSSIQPPTTSTQTPTTSTQQPTTSTQQPTTFTQPPTTSSTQPPTTSSTQPPTTSTQPPTTSSTQPPTTSSTQPPTTLSTQPPTTSSTQPPTTSSTQPPTTSTQPSTASSTQPPSTLSTQPPTMSSTQPPTTSSIQPPTTSSTQPPTTSSIQPPTTSTEPSTTSTTVAPTSSTVPPTSSTAASTQASTLESSTSTSVVTTTTTLTTTDTTPTVPTTAILSTTTSTTVQTTNYPTKPPATEAAIYVFTFVVNVEDPITFTVQWDSGLKDVLEAPFRMLIGFIGLYLRLAASLPRGKRSLDAPMEVGANFSGSSVVTVAADKSGEQMNEFQSNLTTAMTQLTTVGQGNFSVQEDSYDVTAFTEDLTDVCKAEGDVCGADYLCQNNACFYRCEFLNCGSHGQCYVLQTGQGSEAKCRCVSDELYDYSGETCEDSALKDLWIGAFSGGVSGFFILLLVIIVVCVYYKKRSSRKAVASHESVSESQLSPQSPYRHSYVAPMYRPDYDNQAYNHGTSDLYLPPPTIKSDSDMYIRFLTDRNGDRYPVHPQGQRSDLSSNHPYDNAFQPSRYSRYYRGKDNTSPSGGGERQPTHLYFNPPAQRTDDRVFRSENVFHYPLTRKGQGLQAHDGPHPSEGPAYQGYLPRPRVKGESSAREHRHGHESSARNDEQGQNPPSDLSSSSRRSGGFPTTQSEARHLFY